MALPILVCILVSVLLLLPAKAYNADAATSSSLSLEDRILRLHILAAGNDTASQEIKLHVRDAVLTHIQEAVANSTLEDAGVSYRATAELTTEFFPIKQYGSLLLPPGEYRALRIILDEGEGKNWWCMLYPSLCFTEGITATLPDEEKEELRGFLSEDEFDTLFSVKEKKPVFRFKIVELWKKLWGRR